MITMSDVARYANVSTTTVSHVINSTRHVNPETRRRVDQAIAELGYRRDAVAGALAGGRSLTVGFAISGLSNPYFGPLLQSIEQHCAAAGYVLLLGDTHDEPEREHRVISSLLERRPDGLLVAPSPGFLTRTAPLLADMARPLVLVDRTAELEYDQVFSESRTSARQLMAHLLEHGHRRIGIIAGMPGLSSTVERLDGCLDALREHGHIPDPRMVLRGDSDAVITEQVVSDLLSTDDPPTALVVLNNAMTIGAVRAIRRSGLSIPDDVALAVYDDFEWSDLFQPSLTAIAQDLTEVGRQAVQRLIARINGDTSRPRRQAIDTRFHRRSSCGCPAEEQGVRDAHSNG